MEPFTVTLPGSIRDLLEEMAIDRGIYSIDKYVLHLIERDFKRKIAIERVNDLIAEGLEGESTEMTDADWAELRRRIWEKPAKRESA